MKNISKNSQKLSNIVKIEKANYILLNIKLPIILYFIIRIYYKIIKNIQELF